MKIEPGRALPTPHLPPSPQTTALHSSDAQPPLRHVDLMDALEDGRLTAAEVRVKISPHKEHLSWGEPGYDADYRDRLVQLAYWWLPPAAVDPDAAEALRQLLDETHR